MSLAKKIITKGKKFLKKYLKPFWKQAKNLKNLGNYSTNQPTELELIALVDEYIAEGNRFLNLEKPATAVDYYQKVLAISPNHARAFFYWGLLLLSVITLMLPKMHLVIRLNFLKEKKLS